MSPVSALGDHLKGRRRLSAAIVGVAALTSAVFASTGVAAAAPTPVVNVAAPDLGPNTVVFDPSMSTADIQTQVDAIFAQQDTNEMGTARYALLFKPGTYGTQANPLIIRVGYYTEVDGLGQDPSDVTINGAVAAFGHNGSGALDTFWRSVSNLTINFKGIG